jgi:hypothetical protein
LLLQFSRLYASVSRLQVYLAWRRYGPKEIADAKGFAWFWAFLASVAIGVGVLMVACPNPPDDEDA